MIKSSFKRISFIILISILIIITYFKLNRSNKINKLKLNSRLTSNLIGFEEISKADKFLNLNEFSLNELLNNELLTKFNKLECNLNQLQEFRYSNLLLNSNNNQQQSNIKLTSNSKNLNYFIAINLINSEQILPNLILTLIQVITSLNKNRFHLSIYENGSKDETKFQLFLFSKILDKLSIGYDIVINKAEENQKSGNRIKRLSILRNKVLEPLLNSPKNTYDRVIFLNDIVLCPVDILELLLQHEVQQADLSCGMDYKSLKIKEFGNHPPMIFYDNWVARTIEGLPFYKIDSKGGWDLPSEPLAYTPSYPRFKSLLPTQVFSCFNGISIFKSTHFTSPTNPLKFRAEKSSDIQSECYLICTDLWKKLLPWSHDNIIQYDEETGKKNQGARIQIVPRVSVAYDFEDYEKVRKDNFTSEQEEELGGGGGGSGGNWNSKNEMIEWKVWPPKLVAKYPYARWNEESWVPPF